jgi:methylated-DNA-[protein]-cysteine S-methyltransferase
MSTETVLERVVIPSPAGPLSLHASPAGVVALTFIDREPERMDLLGRRFAALRVEACRRDRLGAAALIEAYLEGDLGAIDRIVVDAGGTAFQAEVWRALRQIPVGTTTSYEALARQIGRPRAVRAVGAANGQNPVAIVVPCHRVLAKHGTLHGYGGGLERKRWLLVHERALLA